MVKEALSYLKFGNRFTGVEQTQVNGSIIYYGIVLKKHRKVLDIENRFEATNMETLASQIPKNKAISIVINDDSVITKKISAKENSTQKLVHLAFPNIKFEDFYYDVLSQNNNHFISIIRKTNLDQLLLSFSSNGIKIVHVTLGCLISPTIAEFIDDNTIFLSNCSVNKVATALHDIQKSEDFKDLEYNVNGLEIKSKELLSFSAALNLILKNNLLDSSYNKLKEQLVKNYHETIYTNVFPKLSFGLLFIILLINFLFFNHYYNAVNTLRETTGVLETSKSSVIQLKEKVLKTEQLVEDVLKSASSKSSFYADAIINDLPESILLTELNYQPLTKRIKEDKPIELKENLIIISGDSKDSNGFSQWISNLETIDWISSVEILNYDETDNSFADFSIELLIKNDPKN
jgi:hypothetical protein